MSGKDYEASQSAVDLDLNQDKKEPLLTTPDIQQEGQKVKQYIAALAATFASFGIGTALAWTSPALPYLSSNSTCLEEPMTPEEGAWVGSLVAIGAIIGSIPTGKIADFCGRKWTIVGLGVPAVTSWLMIVFGKSVWMIYIARLLVGMSIGGYSVAIPMYIGEIAEISIRGALGSYFEVLMCIGVMAMYIVGALVDYFWLAIIMTCVPILSTTIFLFMPESPLYLLKKGDRSGAETVLQYLRGLNYDVQPEIQMLQKELNEAEASSLSFRELFKSRANVNASVIGLGLMVVQQMSGVNIVIFYTADLFQAAGSQLSPDTCAIIIGSVQAVVTYICLLLVDKAGRRLLLLCSAIPALCCLIALGTYFNIKESDPDLALKLNWLPLIAVNIYLISIALGLGPIPWMMQGEIFSSSIKGWATSSGAVVNWALVFFVTKTYVNFVEVIGVAGAFWFYAVFTLLGIFFIYFRVPETKGKSFVEIQNLLASR